MAWAFILFSTNTMKRILSILLGCVLVSIQLSCKKQYNPEVKTVSATILPDGSVEVKGEIVSSGNTPIEYSGFCMDTLSVPEMLDNQILSGTSGNNFSTIYSGLDPYKRYYFRAWAANGSEYSYGDIISLDSIQATPVAAPCSLSSNTLILAGSGPIELVYNVGFPTYGIDSWDFSVSTGSTSMDFSFGEMPRTKVYTTTGNMSPGPNDVYISFFSGFTSGVLSSGSSVYVNQITPTSWEITICDAPWTYNSTAFHMKARFNCPL